LAETEAAQIILDQFLNDSRKRRYLGVLNGKSERNIIEHLDNLDRTVNAFCLCCINSMATAQVELLTRGVDRRLQLNTEPAPVAGELVPYRNRFVKLRRRNLRAKRPAWKDRRPKPSMEEKATMPEPSVNSTEGSHVYNNFRIKGNTMFSIGNITDGKTNHPLPAPKNIFSKFQVLDNYGFHIGDVGQSRGDSKFDDGDVADNEVFHIGPYSSLDAKEEDLRKMIEARESIPQ